MEFMRETGRVTYWRVARCTTDNHDLSVRAERDFLESCVFLVRVLQVHLKHKLQCRLKTVPTG